MANETVLFKRGDSATITSTPVTDGQILFDTSGNGKMYLDNGTDRLEMGGAITVDASLSKTSTNAIQNKAVTGNILNSLAEVSAATQQNTIAGALALKEVNSSLAKYVGYWIDNGYLPDPDNPIESLIPILTSNNGDNGIAQTDSEASTPAYYAFNGDDTPFKYNSRTSWVQYTFNNSVNITKISVKPYAEAKGSGYYIKIEASNDNFASKEVLGTVSCDLDDFSEINLSNIKTFKSIRAQLANNGQSYIVVGVKQLQVYGYSN